MSTEAHRTSRHPLLNKLVSAHRTTPGVLFNTLLLFVAVNLALWAAYAWHDHRHEANPLLASRPKDWLAVAFPGWSHADLKAMLDEHHMGGFSYDDYVMFKKTSMRGRASGRGAIEDARNAICGHARTARKSLEA